MSAVGKALYGRMSAHAGLAALVVDRIYPKERPQGSAVPAVTYHQITGPRVSAMGSDPGIVQALYQVSCWASEASTRSAYENAQNVVTQVRAALQRFRGTVNGVEILDCFLEDEGDLVDEDDRTVEGIRLDFRISARE